MSKIGNKIRKLFIINNKDCNTLNCWCLLPANERYCLCFYRKPYSMMMGEWERFEDFMKENHSIQFFFRETFFDFFYYKFCRIKDFRYYLKCLLFKRYHILKLRRDPTWRDFDTNLESSIQVLFFNYIEKEKPCLVFDEEDEYSHQEWKKIAANCYDFLKNIEPHRQKQIDDLMHELFGSPNYKIGQKVDEVKSKKLYKLEDDLDKEKTEVLKQIVEYRHYFWT